MSPRPAIHPEQCHWNLDRGDQRGVALRPVLAERQRRHLQTDPGVGAEPGVEQARILRE